MRAFLVKISPRSPFVIALIPLLLFFVIILGRHWIPIHDTLQGALMFHFFANGFATTGEVPLWFPFTDWGNDPFFPFLMGYLRPTALFLAPLLKLSVAWHTLRFFYLTILLDEIVFLWGTYALAKLLFKNSSSIIWVCIISTGTVFWASQSFFNFYLCYLIPIYLFLIVRGCQERSLWRIILVLALVAYSAIGHTIYFPVMQCFFLSVFLLTCLGTIDCPCGQWFGKWGRGETSAVVALVIALVVPVLFLARSPMPEIIAPGRNIGGIVDYDGFVSYLADPYLTHLSGLLNGVSNARDTTVYGGMFLVPFLLLGIFFRPSRGQIPFYVSGMAIFLLYLGTESFFAPLLFYIPGFALFRHLANLTPFLKLCMVFLAGFGFDAFGEALGDPGVKKRLAPIFTVAFVLICLVAVFYLNEFWPSEGRTPHNLFNLVLALEAVAVFGLVVFYNTGMRKNAVGWVIAITIIDVYSYRARLYQDTLVPVSDEIWSLFQVHPISYTPVRIQNYFDNPGFVKFAPLLFKNIAVSPADFGECMRSGSNCRDSNRFYMGSIYNALNLFLGLDACTNFFRADSVLPWVAALYRPYGLQDAWYARDPPRGEDQFSPRMNRMIGCGYPKLQVLDRLQVMPSEQEALDFITHSMDSSEGLVSSAPAMARYQARRSALKEKGDLGAEGSASPIRAEVKVEGFEANRISLEVRTPPGGGAHWLYYADAWHPNWEARVNGSPVAILQSNVAFKAVRIPSGRAQVSFQYRSVLSRCLILITWMIATVEIGTLLIWIAWELRGKVARAQLSGLGTASLPSHSHCTT